MTAATATGAGDTSALDTRLTRSPGPYRPKGECRDALASTGLPKVPTGVPQRHRRHRISEGRVRLRAEEPLTPAPAPRPLEALTVDLWYTLISPSPVVRTRIETARRAVWADALQEAGCSPRRSARWARVIEASADEAEQNGFSPTWAERVDRWSHRIRVSLDAEELAAHFTEKVPLWDVRVAPGARESLAQLRHDGIRLAIVSNATHEPPEAVRKLLRAHGLDEPFDSVVLSTDVGRAKPRREPFDRALQLLGARPGSSVHVGDAEADFRGAIAAGMHPLIFTGLRRWKPERLRLSPPPWLGKVLRVSRWSEVPRTCAFFGALPPVPQLS